MCHSRIDWEGTRICIVRKPFCRCSLFGMQRKDAMRAVEEFSLRHRIMSIAINYAIFKKSDAMLERSARSDEGRVMPLTCHVRLKKNKMN